MQPRNGLVISILLNLVLLGVIYLRPGASSREKERLAPIRQPGAENAAPRPEPRTIVKVVTNFISLDWSAIETADYKLYIKNLREVSCPEETIRDIIMADVNKLFLKQWQAVVMPKDWKYWVGEPSIYMNPVLDSQRKTLIKERDLLVRELLDVDYQLESSKLSFVILDTRSAQLGFLPEVKQQQVRRIYDKYQSLNRASASPSPTSADARAAKARRNQEAAEIAQLLTSEEWDAYQLRCSGWAQMARQGLVGLEVTEDEFIRLYRQTKPLFDERTNLDYSTDREAAMQRSRELTASLAEQGKAVLGEQRFKDYQRSQDFSFQGLVMWGSQFGLSRATAGVVYDTQKAFEDASRTLQLSRALAPDQRREARQSLIADAENKLRTAMTEEAYQAYKVQYGSWLR